MLRPVAERIGAAAGAALGNLKPTSYLLSTIVRGVGAWQQRPSVLMRPARGRFGRCCRFDQARLESSRTQRAPSP